MYIPVVGFLLILLLLSKIPNMGILLATKIGGTPAVLAIIAVSVSIVMYSISILISIKIVKNMEMWGESVGLDDFGGDSFDWCWDTYS